MTPTPSPHPCRGRGLLLTPSHVDKWDGTRVFRVGHCSCWGTERFPCPHTPGAELRPWGCEHPPATPSLHPPTPSLSSTWSCQARRPPRCHRVNRCSHPSLTPPPAHRHHTLARQEKMSTHWYPPPPRPLPVFIILINQDHRTCLSILRVALKKKKRRSN